MDYGGLKGLIELNKEEILKRVTQENIFELIFNKVSLQGFYTNPLREDTHADAYFQWYKGKLWFVDFADTKNVRDCFEMLKDYYKLNFHQVLLHINNSFQLGLSDDDTEVTLPKLEIPKITIKENPDTTITYRTKIFDSHHKKYWTRYEINKDQLIQDNIYATIWYKFWSNKTQDWVTIRPMASDTTFTIAQWEDAVKICRPYHKGKGKWITNCTQNHIGGTLNLSKDTLIITKSYKDWRVLTNQGLHCIWFQNEGMFPNKEMLMQLCSHFKEIIIWFDNDESGIQAAKKLNQLISSFHPNCKYIHLPTLLGKKNISDPADCIYKDKEFFNHFITKTFYNGKINCR